MLRRRRFPGSSVPLNFEPRAAGRQEACHVALNALSSYADRSGD